MSDSPITPGGRDPLAMLQQMGVWAPGTPISPHQLPQLFDAAAALGLAFSELSESVQEAAVAGCGVPGLRPDDIGSFAVLHHKTCPVIDGGACRCQPVVRLYGRKAKP